MIRQRHRKIDQAQLVIEATERFGPDPKHWAFKCPNCGDVACAQDFIDAGANPDVVGQDCIGRHLGALASGPYTGRGCNWAAYGLIPGPWEITGDDKTMRVFPLADAPAVAR